MPPSKEIKAQYDRGEAMLVQLHDGSQIVLRKTDKDYNPTDRTSAYNFLQRHQQAGEIVTGLLFVDQAQPDLHELNQVTSAPLASLPFDQVCPGNDALQKLQDRFR